MQLLNNQINNSFEGKKMLTSSVIDHVISLSRTMKCQKIQNIEENS